MNWLLRHFENKLFIMISASFINSSKAGNVFSDKYHGWKHSKEMDFRFIYWKTDVLIVEKFFSVFFWIWFTFFWVFFHFLIWIFDSNIFFGFFESFLNLGHFREFFLYLDFVYNFLNFFFFWAFYFFHNFFSVWDISDSGFFFEVSNFGIFCFFEIWIVLFLLRLFCFFYQIFHVTKAWQIFF